MATHVVKRCLIYERVRLANFTIDTTPYCVAVISWVAHYWVRVDVT